MAENQTKKQKVYCSINPTCKHIIHATRDKEVEAQKETEDEESNHTEDDCPALCDEGDSSDEEEDGSDSEDDDDLLPRDPALQAAAPATAGGFEHLHESASPLLDLSRLTVPEDNPPEWQQNKPFTANSINADAYIKICKGKVSNTIEHILREGLVLKPRDRSQIRLKNRITPEQAPVLKVMIAKLLEQGVLSAIQPEDATFVLPMFLVPKAQPGEWRFIFDARALNERISGWKIRLEGLRNLPMLMKTGDVVVKIDLVQGFYHVPLRGDTKQYVCVEHEGKYYQYNSLAMGIKPATAVMTKVMRPLLAAWRADGLRFIHCVDDLLLLASPDDIVVMRDRMLDDLTKAGFHINWKKSALVPGTLILFLGMLVDSKLQRIFVPQHKADEAVTMAKELANSSGNGEMRSYRWMKKLARLVGKLVAMTPGLQTARIGTRTLLQLQKAHSRADVDAVLAAEPNAYDKLLWWAETMPMWAARGVPVFRETIETSLQLIADGSVHGWGGRFSHAGKTEDIMLSAGTELFDEWHDGEGENEQSEREFLTILELLPRRAAELKGKVLVLYTDSANLVSHIAHGGGPSKRLTAIILRIWTWCAANSTTLLARHIPAAEMVRSGVDRLSREQPSLRFEIRLHPRFFKWANGVLGPHAVDRMASVTAHQTDAFNAKGCVQHGDAFSCAWSLPEGQRNWCFPDEAQLDSVLVHLQRHPACTTLLVPQWTSRPWWTELKSMAVSMRPLPDAGALGRDVPRFQIWRDGEWQAFHAWDKHRWVLATTKGGTHGGSAVTPTHFA